MKSRESDKSAFCLMALTVFIWGLTWVVLKAMAAYIGPFDLVTLRYGLGFAVLLVILLASGQRLAFPPFWLTMGMAVFQTAAFSCLSQFALVSGGTGHVVMLAYTMPFWVVVFAWVLLHQRPTRWHARGCVLAGIGLLAVIAPWQGLGGFTSSLLAVGSGACWGLGTIYSKMIFMRHSTNVLSLTTWQMGVGALLTLPFALLQPEMQIEWEPRLIAGLVFLSAISTAAGWLMWLNVVRRVSATVASMSSLGVPVLAIIFAWILLSERPTLLEAAGMTLMMAGLVVVNLGSLKRAG